MEISKKNNWLLYFFSILLVAGFFSLFIIIFNSSSVSVSTILDVDNVSPSINTVFINTSPYIFSDNTGGIMGTLNTNSGADFTYFVNGVVSDLNGRDDIDHVELSFYRNDLSFGCVSDKNNCYRVSSCSLRNNGNLGEKEYSCQIDLSYYADSTSIGGAYPSNHFVVGVKVVDADAIEVINATLTKNIATNLSLNIANALPYGSRLLNSESTAGNNYEMPIEQYGNDEAGLKVKGNALSCSGGGTILLEDQKWSLTDVGWTNPLAISLTGGDVDTNFSITYRDNDSTSLVNKLYWNVRVGNFVKGSCSGVSTLTVIPI
ncbi:MAG: hypothetical protein Q8P90_00745 [bacterium]|nr:hypothetical protein [bacterium]